MNEHAPRNVASDFKSSEGTPLIAALFPSATITEIERVFAGRAGRGHISDWRRGVRSVPQWARDILAAHFEAIERDARSKRELAQKEKAPGRKASARNLLNWLAANPR